MRVSVRSAFDYDSEAASLEAVLDCSDLPTMTQQQFAEEVDINTIVRRFGITGTMPGTLAMPLNGDFTGVSDFQTALHLVKDAQAEFMKVPAEIRARFGNDPGAFMAFLSDDRNRAEAVRLGLVVEPEKPRAEAPKA